MALRSFGTDGVIYSVMNDGALRWHRYVGQGEHDPSAATGWASNTGNQIGNGW